MKLTQALLPLSYFGPISHFAVNAQLDAKFEIHETYQKSSFRNKCQILGSNGVLDLSVPLRKGKTSTAIQNVKIAYDENWVDNHLKTIKSAYGTSPYYDYYFNYIEELLKQKVIHLFDLNVSMMEWLKNLGVLPEISFTERFDKELGTDVVDLRNRKLQLEYQCKPYDQVFSDKFGFVKELSILDLLFNLGPESPAYLKEIKLDIMLTL